MNVALIYDGFMYYLFVYGNINWTELGSWMVWGEIVE